MKKISLAFCLTLLSSLFCPAQVSPLQFNKNGEFKSSSLQTSTSSMAIRLRILL